MYSTGKITTTANSTRVIGTNTKWQDNNSLVSPEQVILIQSGSTIYINSIASIQSNTEMTLGFPMPVAVNYGTYNILTTMINSVSDAINKIVTLNNANMQFSDIQNRLMTESGVITVVFPDGSTQQMRTEKERDRLLDSKLDKDKNGEDIPDKPKFIANIGLHYETVRASGSSYDIGPSGMIYQSGVEQLTAAGSFNAQVLGGVTYYTNYYGVIFPKPFPTAQISTVVSLVSSSATAQSSMAGKSVSVHKGDDTSKDRFIVAYTTPNLSEIPTIHFVSVGY